MGGTEHPVQLELNQIHVQLKMSSSKTRVFAQLLPLISFQLNEKDHFNRKYLGNWSSNISKGLFGHLDFCTVYPWSCCKAYHTVHCSFHLADLSRESNLVLSFKIQIRAILSRFWIKQGLVLARQEGPKTITSARSVHIDLIILLTSVVDMSRSLLVWNICVFFL